jgi:pectinesterase
MNTGFPRRTFLQGTLATTAAAASVIEDSPATPFNDPDIKRRSGFDAVVAQDGTGTHRTVQQAINASPKSANAGRPWTIFVKAGVYKELIYIQREKRYLRLLGAGAEITLLTYDLHESVPGRDGQPIGVFRTPTIQIDADDFAASDLTFENTAGPADRAVAIRVDGDRVVFRRCRLLGWEDATLLNRGRQYFDRCILAGGYDFILGGSTAFFDRCRIICRGNGFITAASTPADQTFGYVFAGCTIDAESKAVKTYLGRLWGPYANVTFLRTWMSETVLPEGWHEVVGPNSLRSENQSDRRRTARFSEYGSRGPGANPSGRVSWSRQLEEAEADQITIPRVLGGSDGWQPTSILPADAK